MDNNLKIIYMVLISIIIILPLISASSSLTDGLVAYYTFDVDMNLTDSLYQKNLTNSGAVFNAAGLINQAADQERDITAYMYTPALGNLSDMTICWWISQEQGGIQMLFGRSSPDPHLYCRVNNGGFGCNGGAGQGIEVSIPIKQDTSWQFVCFQGNSTSLSIWVNGTWTSTTTVYSIIDNTNPVYNTRYRGYTRNSFDGRIDEWGIWNRSLTASEISELYNSGAGLSYPFAPADTCTCAGAGNDWEIDHSDYCNITDACDLTTGTLSFTGAGITRLNSTIKTTNLGDPGASGILKILSDCLIWIKGT